MLQTEEVELGVGWEKVVMMVMMSDYSSELSVEEELATYLA